MENNIIIYIAQVFGILGALSNILSSWQKTKNKIFVFLFLDNILYAIQYLLLGAYTGAVISLIGIFRLYLFGKGKKHFIKFKNLPLYLVLFIYLVSGILTFSSIASLLPIFASLLYAVALWNDNPSNIRKGASISLFCWFIYNLLVGAYVGALTEFVLFTSSVLAIYRLDIRKKKEKKNE